MKRISFTRCCLKLSISLGELLLKRLLSLFELLLETLLLLHRLSSLTFELLFEIFDLGGVGLAILLELSCQLGDSLVGGALGKSGSLESPSMSGIGSLL